MTELVFARTEKKYRIAGEQIERFLEKIAPHVEEDIYGCYSLNNLYFDTETDELIQRSLEKPVYKEKLRLRSYGIPGDEDKVFLELKKKYKGVVYKRRAEMTMEEARNYLDKGVKPALANHQIMNEIDYFMQLYHPEPKLFLAYDRRAYSGIEDEQLRITIDWNIRSRREHIDLQYGDEGQKLLGEDEAILEIKGNYAMPLWLVDILNEESIFPVSFSKYGEIYKKEQLDGGRCYV